MQVPTLELEGAFNLIQNIKLRNTARRRQLEYEMEEIDRMLAVLQQEETEHMQQGEGPQQAGPSGTQEQGEEQGEEQADDDVPIKLEYVDLDKVADSDVQDGKGKQKESDPQVLGLCDFTMCVTTNPTHQEESESSEDDELSNDDDDEGMPTGEWAKMYKMKVEAQEGQLQGLQLKID